MPMPVLAPVLRLELSSPGGGAGGDVDGGGVEDEVNVDVGLLDGDGEDVVDGSPSSCQHMYERPIIMVTYLHQPVQGAAAPRHF